MVTRAQLQQDRDTVRADIERRRIERESDPLAFDDWCRSECSDARAIGASPVSENESAAVIYRTCENNQPTATAAAAVSAEAVSEAMAELIAHERGEREQLQREITTLRETVAELRGKLDLAVEIIRGSKTGEVATLPKPRHVA